MLSLQTDFSFVRAAVACAIIRRISGLEQSSETSAPNYLKLVTIHSFCPFTLIYPWMPLVLFVISSVYSALLSILYLVKDLSRLSIRASSSWYSSAKAAVSPGKCRSVMLPPKLTFPSCCSRASDMIRLRNILERVARMTDDADSFVVLAELYVALLRKCQISD